MLTLEIIIILLNAKSINVLFFSIPFISIHTISFFVILCMLGAGLAVKLLFPNRPGKLCTADKRAWKGNCHRTKIRCEEATYRKTVHHSITSYTCGGPIARAGGRMIRKRWCPTLLIHVNHNLYETSAEHKIFSFPHLEMCAPQAFRLTYFAPIIGNRAINQFSKFNSSCAYRSQPVDKSELHQVVGFIIVFVLLVRDWNSECRWWSDDWKRNMIYARVYQ